MIGQDLITKFKYQYGEVYSVSIGKSEYVFRALTLRETDLIDFTSEESSADAEDQAVLLGLLYPQVESLDDIPAGAITTLADEIRKVSGYGTAKYAKQLLDMKRAESTQIRGIMKAFVLATMPAYTEEDLDNLTFTNLAGKVALAEQIIQVQQAMLPAAAGDSEVKLQIVDPEEEALKAAQREAKEKQKYERLAKKGMLPTTDEGGPVVKPKIKADDPIAQKLRQAMG